MKKRLIGDLHFPFSNNLLAYWPCNSIENDLIPDETGNGNDLVLSDTLSKPCVDGTGIRLDGTNYVAQKSLFTRNPMPGDASVALNSPAFLLDPGITISEGFLSGDERKTAFFAVNSLKLVYGFLGNKGDVKTLDNESIINGTFEDGLTGWTLNEGSGSVDDETTIVHSGEHAIKITGGLLGDVSFYQDVSITPGSVYEFNAWLKRTLVSGTIDFTLSIGEGSPFLTKEISVGTDYQESLFYVGIPTGSSYSTLRIGFKDSNNGNLLTYIDDFSFKKVLTINSEDGCFLFADVNGGDQSVNHAAAIFDNQEFDPNDITSYVIYSAFSSFKKAKTWFMVIIPDESDSSGYLMSRAGSGYVAQELFFNAVDNLNGSPANSINYTGMYGCTSDAVFSERGVPVFIMTTFDDDGNLTFYRNNLTSGQIQGSIDEGWAPIIFGSYYSTQLSKIVDGSDGEEFTDGCLPKFTLCMSGVLNNNLSQSEAESLYLWTKAECIKRGIALP